MPGYEAVKYIVKQRAKRSNVPHKVMLRTNDLEEARNTMKRYEKDYTDQSFFIDYTELGIKELAKQPRAAKKTHLNNRTVPKITFSRKCDDKARASSARILRRR